jgi:ABC-type uncharacterized transport system auxiliary subunit
MIQRRFFLVGASALALSGCGKDLIGPPEASPIYVVKPQFPAAPGGGAKVPWALSILHPEMTGALDSERIALFQADGSMDYYAKATYPDRLSPIVQHALLDGFEASGRIDAVAREEAALHADYDLAIDVKDFAAHYNAPDGVPSVTVSGGEGHCGLGADLPHACQSGSAVNRFARQAGGTVAARRHARIAAVARRSQATIVPAARQNSHGNLGNRFRVSCSQDFEMRSLPC